MHHQSAHRAYDSEYTIRERRVSPRHSRHRGQAEHKHHPTCTLSLYLMCPKVVSRPRPQLWHITSP